METYFTLRHSLGLEKQEIADGQFGSFEEAYARMVELYNEETAANKPHKLWAIWRTNISRWKGNENSMTQAVWG